MIFKGCKFHGRKKKIVKEIKKGHNSKYLDDNDAKDPGTERQRLRQIPEVNSMLAVVYK